MYAIRFIVLLLLLFTTFFSSNSYAKNGKNKNKRGAYWDGLQTEFYAGRIWTMSSTRELARGGQVYSLQMEIKDGKVGYGTEFSYKYWDDIYNKKEARKIDFNQEQCLWLIYFRYYLTSRKCKPYVGGGTDLITCFEIIIRSLLEGEKDSSYQEESVDLLTTNVWFCPHLGVNYSCSDHLKIDVKCTLDLSKKHNSIRLQGGITYQF